MKIDFDDAHIETISAALDFVLKQTGVKYVARVHSVLVAIQQPLEQNGAAPITPTEDPSHIKTT